MPGRAERVTQPLGENLAGRVWVVGRDRAIQVQAQDLAAQVVVVQRRARIEAVGDVHVELAVRADRQGVHLMIGVGRDALDHRLLPRGRHAVRRALQAKHPVFRRAAVQLVRIDEADEEIAALGLHGDAGDAGGAGAGKRLGAGVEVE